MQEQETPTTRAGCAAAPAASEGAVTPNAIVSDSVYDLSASESFTDIDLVCKASKPPLQQQQQAPTPAFVLEQQQQQQVEATPTDAVQRQGDWCEFRDPNSGELYYYNERTQLSQWVPPSDWAGGSAEPVQTTPVTAAAAAAVAPTTGDTQERKDHTGEDSLRILEAAQEEVKAFELSSDSDSDADSLANDDFLATIEGK